MRDNNLILSYLNDTNNNSSIIKNILNFLSTPNSEVYVFGGFLRECVSRQNITSINNYLLKEDGDIDIVVNHLNNTHLMQYLLSIYQQYNIQNVIQSTGNYTNILEKKIINAYKQKYNSISNIKKMLSQLKGLALHYKYTIIFNNNNVINIDILITKNISKFISSNLDLSVNSLYFNYNTSQLLSKCSKIISYDTIIQHIKDKKFTIINTTRFIQIIYRIFKIINNRKYSPIYEDIYTYTYILSRVIKVLKYKSKLNQYLSKNNQQYIFNKLNSNFIFDLLSNYNITCNKCGIDMMNPSIICKTCQQQYYKYNSKILDPIHLSSKILFKFTTYSIWDYNSKLYNLINNIYYNYIYQIFNYNCRLKLFNYIANCKTSNIIQYFQDCNFHKQLQYYDLCILANYSIIYSNYILLEYLLTLININDIPYQNNENILELSFQFKCYKICKLINTNKFKISKTTDLFYEICMSNNLKLIQLYLESCQHITNISFSNQFINNLISNTNYEIIIYLRNKFNFKFTNNNIIRFINKYKKIENNYITFVPKLGNILSNYSEPIDIYPQNHWKYNPIPKYILHQYFRGFAILCDHNISINKLLVYIDIYKHGILKDVVTTSLISYYYLKNLDLMNQITQNIF